MSTHDFHFAQAIIAERHRDADHRRLIASTRKTTRSSHRRIAARRNSRNPNATIIPDVVR